MPTFKEDLHLGHSVPTIDTEDIEDGAITEKKMADGSASTRTIQNGAVTEPKIANGAVTEPKLADWAVSTRTVRDKAISERKLADLSVSTRTIQDKSVTNSKIANSTISMGKLDNDVQTKIQQGTQRAWAPKGNYSAETVYNVNDLVYYPDTNSSYISLQANNQGHSPVWQSATGGWWMMVLDGSYLNVMVEELEQAIAQAIEDAQEDISELISDSQATIDAAVSGANSAAQAANTAAANAEAKIDWVEEQVDSLTAYEVATKLDETSIIPVQNKVVTEAIRDLESQIPKQTKVLFQNSANVQWLSGNIASNGTIVTNYANRYYRLLIPEGVEYLEYERTTLDSDFNVAGYVSASATSGYTNVVATTQTYKKVDVRGYKYFLLLCWDKPTLEQVQSINITLSYTKLTTEIGITKDYFDETQSSVPSMSILSPMAKNVYVKKFITGDGITWEQGGVNGNTGALETNSRAIRTNAIYLNGDNYAIASIDAIPKYNVAIAVYDENGAYKSWQTSAFTNPYPNGYIRFVVYAQSGSGNILPSRGGETNALVIRHGELEYRVSQLEQRASYIEQSALTYFNNPVIRSDNPDPAVWYGEDGYWYLFATGTLATKTMWRSANLVDWENTGETPFTQNAISIWTELGHTTFWAPEVVKVGNRWNLYLSATQNPMYVFSSDHPTFGYEYVGVIANHIFGGSHENIDACVRYDRDGTLWLFLDGSTVGMYRVKLNEDGTSVISSTLEHVAGLPSNASGNVNRAKTYEGAYLYRRKGYWYLIVSAGRYQDSSYCLRVGRSATLNGTFVDKEGNPMSEGNSSLLLSSTGTFYGTGHNGAIITDKNNKTWMLFHSHWTGASSSSVRPACISEVLWDENGWPYFENNTLTVKGFGPTM